MAAGEGAVTTFRARFSARTRGARTSVRTNALSPARATASVYAVRDAIRMGGRLNWVIGVTADCRLVLVHAHYRHAGHAFRNVLVGGVREEHLGGEGGGGGGG